MNKISWQNSKMSHLKYYEIYKDILKCEPFYLNMRDSSCNEYKNVGIIVHCKKNKQENFMDKERNTQQPKLIFLRYKKRKHKDLKQKSMPELIRKDSKKPVKLGTKSFVPLSKVLRNSTSSKFVVNVVSEHRHHVTPNPFNFNKSLKWKVYRCQLNTNTEGCCCSCNSDAMFEVMKSLYDCYKKKNCDNCNCILCGHLYTEERRKGELRKSLASVGLETEGVKAIKEKTKNAEKAMVGKSAAEKEKILRDLAFSGIPLPEGKTESEKLLVGKVLKDLGLPPAAKTATEKANLRKAAELGLFTPLNGKTNPQKEKILKGLIDMGIPLPEGRTQSEKELIQRVKDEAGIPVESLAEKMHKAKADGLLTPLEGKTPAQKEKILQGLAMRGIPLPEGKTASEKNLIDKVRTNLGLPPEPKTSDMKDKHARAAEAGLLQPLEGKTPKEKEKILRGLHNMGIPLPEGRTASEKSLVARIAKEPRRPSKVTPSEKLRRAKAEGLLTPLQGKSPEQKEKILRGLAMAGIPLPEGQTPSQKKLIKKVRADVGLPPEPKTAAMRDIYAKAADAGIMQPLEGKTPREKEKILRGLHNMGIPLPEGRTASEKSLIAKIAKEPREPSILQPSEKMRRAKADGLLTPLKGKTPEQKEKILRGLAMLGMPLPEGKTASEKNLIDKVRTNLGLPPEPTTSDMKDKHARAADAGLLQPLEGKTPREKEKILRGLHNMGIPLPDGRTASEKSLIAKIAKEPREPSILPPSEKMRRAKADGLLTPLKGKTPEQKEKILRGLAMLGMPLPEGKTTSEKNLIDKVRTNLGLPPEPKTFDMKDKHARAADAGLLQPLEGKTPREKEKILRGLHNMGIPLPTGRTASEKSLIAKIAKEPREPSILPPSEKMRRAKADGLLTPLKGKTPEQKEKILRGLAMLGIPLPEGKTASEKNLIDKVRADLGLPPEPKTSDMKDKHAKAADVGLLQPLEGKTPREKEKILRGLHNIGIPLPEGRTASEKSLIAKIAKEPREPSILQPSEKMRRAKAGGLLTPLKGKSPEQKEKILRGLAMLGMPLPEGKTASEKNLIDKVRTNLGLPPEPKTSDMKDKHARAADAGLLQPLEGKTPREKEKILRGLQNMGIPLPEGRTASEKSLIARIAKEPREPSILPPSEKMRRAKAEGLLTPLEGKTPAQKEKILRGLAIRGIPLPEGKSASEKNLIDKVRADLGLPPEPKTSDMKDKHARAANAGFLRPLEGRTPKEKEKILRGLHNMGIPLPKGRTASEKSLIARIAKEPREPSILPPSEKMRRAKAEGLLTPLEGKTPAQKKNILRGLAMRGIPLPEGKTASEKKLIDKVRTDLGLPPEPKTPDMKTKYARAADAGLLRPLEGKTPKEKEKILRGLHNMGIPLPAGRTASEKSLVARIAKEPREPSVISPSEKIRRAKDEGLLTPLEGKPLAQKEKILRGLAKRGIPLPEGKTASDKKLIDKVRAELGLPPEPKTQDMRARHAKAADAGFLQPLEGKTPQEKEKILRGLHNMGIPLPKGRTPSEKFLIAKIKELPKSERLSAIKPFSITTEKIRKAKAAGLFTPLEGKTTDQKRKILANLAKARLPLPEGKTLSEKALIKKIKEEHGIPDEPHPEMIRKAKAAGYLTPLEGKTPDQKEKILRGRVAAGLPLPEGRTPSEKDLINKIKATTGYVTPSPSERLKKAEAAGLLIPLKGKTRSAKEKILNDMLAAGVPIPEGTTPSEKDLIQKLITPKGLSPLKGKSPEEKEKILKGFIKAHLPLPEAETKSDKDIIDKVRADLGLPPEPQSPSMKEKYKNALAAGIITPLEGKNPADKEKILRKLQAEGIPLPEGRTPSEKSMIKKIKKEARKPSTLSARLKAAKAIGLLTPLKGKTPKQKEKILRGLAKAGLPLPEAETPSEKSLIKKVIKDMGLPPEPETMSQKEKMKKAYAAGIITPLEGKTPAQKENILRDLVEAGIPLPEGKTTSEKAMINKIKAEGPRKVKLPSEKLKKAKALGLMTPLQGKSQDEKERIMKGLAELGLPIPEGTTPSERKLSAKVRKELGLPPIPRTPSMRERHDMASAAGILKPLEGLTPEEKRKVLKAQAEMGIPLPEGRTPSEKSLVSKIKEEVALSKIPSAKLRAAKAAGLLTPLKGKSPEQKKKIIRGLAEAGLPLPEGRTHSEKSMIKKVKAEFGIPPTATTPSEISAVRKAKAKGLFTPLAGKTPDQKEKILRGLAEAGLPLPEGTTPSEKALITKIKAEQPTKIRLPADKLKKVKALGLMTPLQGKPQDEKERIMRGLAELGLPIPEGTTPSERKLSAKVRKELGLPPIPRTPSMRERHDMAAVAGVLKPLEGLTPEEKRKVLKAQAEMGIPLPEGRTPSEKALIAKIKEEVPTKIPSAKLRAAKAAGLLTPLAGKSRDEKNRIVRGLAEAGLPLPEGHTQSEKSLIKKVKAEFGIPPIATTPSEISAVRKAKAKGLFTPLTGKTAEQKEKILKGLAEAGMPLPVGKTASEKNLIKKVRAEAGLPAEPTPSERIGKIRKKKAGKVGKTEIEEIVKTTTCEHACGCDKKKIRFKHSYIKIKVTSPDISSLCPCPNECLPGVKGGVFVDNEGIKVTIGSAIGVPSYSCEDTNITAQYQKEIKGTIKSYTNCMDFSNSNIHILFDNSYRNTNLENKRLCKIRGIRNVTSSHVLLPINTPICITASYEGRNHNSRCPFVCSRDIYYKNNRPSDVISNLALTNCYGDSFDSIIIIKSETSLSLSSTNGSIVSNSNDSEFSFMNDSATSISTDYLYISDCFTSDSLIDTPDYNSFDSIKSDNLDESTVRKHAHNNKTRYEDHNFAEIRNFKRNLNKEYIMKQAKKKLLEICKEINSENDISTVVKENIYPATSSIFVFVPTSEDDFLSNSSISISISEI